MDPASLPVLYANVNTDLEKQARSAAKEALIAAWYYLGNRYREEWQQPGAVQKDYKALSIRLANLLEQDGDVRDQDLYESVQKDVDRLTGLSEE